MKRIVAVIIVALIVFTSLPNYASINNAGFEGGIHRNERDYNDTKQYKEVIFITGKPIVLEGTVELEIDEEELTYEYELTNKDKTVILEREIELERIIDDNQGHRQVVEVNNILDYEETITIEDGNGEGEYELVEYQFHNSTLDDNQPVVDYYHGSWLGTKVYSINEDEGQVTVSITGNIYGYDHYWGATETQTIHQDINYVYIDEDGDEIDWYGYADIDVSFNRTKTMEYTENLAYQSSFDGSYTLTEKDETVMKYSYELPRIRSNGTPSSRKSFGQGVERYDTLPTQQRLFVPKYEDIKGNWAEWDIKRLAGLQVIDGTDKYFGHSLDMKRSDFAKWIVLAMNLVEEEEEKPKRSYKKEEVVPALFSDVASSYPDYKYIKAVKENEIMNGIGDNKFLPEGNLTRAEAITIVIRSLGLERLAPNPPFQTRFVDDNKIPQWAKKYIYVADQLGIAKGTPEGYIYPNENMTKAEAAAFINRFITYLQQNLKLDYRENIMNY